MVKFDTPLRAGDIITYKHIWANNPQLPPRRLKELAAFVACEGLK